MVLKVETRYKEDIKPVIKQEPKQNVSVSEFLKDMADAGFTGAFKALNNDGRLYKGDLIALDSGQVVVKARKVPQQEEARKKLLQMLNN